MKEEIELMSVSPTYDYPVKQFSCDNLDYIK
jgi:hypothetical protein